MERERYQPSQYESPDDSAEDDSDSTKKKKSKRAQDLARLLAQHDSKEPTGETKPESESLWNKLTGRGEDKSEPAESKKRPAKTDDAETVEDELSPAELTVESVPESEAPLEELSEEEQLLAMQAYVEARLQELAEAEESADAELSDEDATVRSAIVGWLQRLRDRLAQAEGTVATEIDESYRESAAELLGNTGSEAEAGSNLPAYATEQPRPFGPDQAVPLNRTVGGHSGGGGERPPVAPWPMPERPENHAAAQPQSSHAVPGRSSRQERTISEDDAYYYEAKAQQRGLLVGGIVGYLIGRRRGRIKTEKRLASVHKKLEKQVESAQRRISEKEKDLVRLAHQQIKHTEQTPVAAAGRPEAAPAARRQPAAAETVSARAAQPERATVQPELPAAVRPEAAAEPAKNEQAAAKPDKPLERLNRQELLNLSGTIRFGETNLRRVFEARLVNENGLRRLIREYYAGHDLRRALAREFLAKELRFERDPRLRDAGISDIRPTDQHSQTAASQHADEPTIASATAVSHDAPSSSSTPPVSKRVTVKSPRQATVSPLLLTILTLITIGLAIYAIWLTITR